MIQMYNCERWPERDFKDDKNSFLMYKYKGKLPISCMEKGGKLYLCIRPDYLGIQHKNEDFEIISYFNCVPVHRYDPNLFERLCEYIYQKYVMENTEVERPKI